MTLSSKDPHFGQRIVVFKGFKHTKPQDLVLSMRKWEKFTTEAQRKRQEARDQEVSSRKKWRLYVFCFLASDLWPLIIYILPFIFASSAALWSFFIYV
jgi:hypothetical protein